MYMVHAFQALSLRPKLLESLFPHYDVEKGIYIVRVFKNGVYNVCEIDDYVPCRGDGHPLTAHSEFFHSCNPHKEFYELRTSAKQSVVWPCVLEKAYAKMHCCG